MVRLITRLAISVAACLLAAIIALFGVGFLCFAFYLALLQHLSPPLAALATAGATFVLAALIILGGWAIGAMVKSRRKSPDERLLTALFGEFFGHEFSTRAASHPQATLFASLLAGFVVGANPGLRRLLRDLFFKS